MQMLLFNVCYNTVKEKSRLQNGLIQKRPLSVSMFNTSLPSTVFFTTNKGNTNTHIHTFECLVYHTEFIIFEDTNGNNSFAILDLRHSLRTHGDHFTVFNYCLSTHLLLSAGELEE